MTTEGMSVRDGALLEGRDDYVAASWVYSLAMESGARSDADRGALAVGVVSELIATKLMVAGDLGSRGFQPWDGDEGEAVKRVTLR